MPRRTSDPRFQPCPLQLSLTRFVFDRRVSMDDVADTLRLARAAAGSLHGVERVQLDAINITDRARRMVAIDVMTDAGHSLALIFLGFCRREYGEAAFTLIPASNASTRAMARTGVLS